MGFDLAKLKISIQTKNTARLLAWLPTCGREFSAICKKAVCNSPTECHASCHNGATCPWFLIFGQQLSHDSAALKRYQKPPLPFAFSYSANDPGVVECGLVIVGNAINHTALLGNAFVELCLSEHAPAQCSLMAVESLDLQGKSFPLRLDQAGSTDLENLVVFSSDEIIDNSKYGSSEIVIRLLSPLRLIEQGRQSSRFEFARFAGSVMRRVSSLAYYYGGYEFESDFKDLSRQATEAICTDYKFQKGSCGSSSTAGLCGNGSFIGDFDGLMPFLLLGAFFNTGKGAAYGLGRYEVVV